VSMKGIGRGEGGGEGGKDMEKAGKVCTYIAHTVDPAITDMVTENG
jgi:hypothetical protein